MTPFYKTLTPPKYVDFLPDLGETIFYGMRLSHSIVIVPCKIVEVTDILTIKNQSVWVFQDSAGYQNLPSEEDQKSAEWSNRLITLDEPIGHSLWPSEKDFIFPDLTTAIRKMRIYKWKEWKKYPDLVAHPNKKLRRPDKKFSKRRKYYMSFIWGTQKRVGMTKEQGIYSLEFPMKKIYVV